MDRFKSRFVHRVVGVVVALCLLSVGVAESPDADATLGPCGGGHYHSVGHPVYGGQVYHGPNGGSGGWENWYSWNVTSYGGLQIPGSYIGRLWCSGGYPPWA